MKGVTYFYDLVYVIIFICVGIMFLKDLMSAYNAFDSNVTRQTDKILYDEGDGIQMEYSAKYGAFLPMGYMELKRTGAEVIADLYVQDQYSPTTNLVESAGTSQTILIPENTVSVYQFKALKDCAQRWSTNLLNLKSSGFQQNKKYELVLDYANDRWEYQIAN